MATNPWIGKDSTKATAWEALTPEDQYWLRNGDPTDSVLLSRAPNKGKSFGTVEQANAEKSRQDQAAADQDSYQKNIAAAQALSANNQSAAEFNSGFNDISGYNSTSEFNSPINQTQQFGVPIPGVNNNIDSSGTDPSVLRMQGKLNPGGEASAASKKRPTDVKVEVITQSGPMSGIADEDWRIKISLAPNNTLFYKGEAPGILAPLRTTQGVIFPYTPQITVEHSARYAEQKLTHSNYASYFYEGSEVSAISIAGDFTVQTYEEGQYLLAAVSFFRSCTKMFFGTQDGQNAGSPPPLVFLQGYGQYYFPKVPCVITKFSHQLPAEVDYVEVGINRKDKGSTRVPTTSTLNVTLQPTYSRKFIHENFNLNDFASGSLLTSKGGFI